MEAWLIELTTVDEVWKAWIDYVQPRIPVRKLKTSQYVEQHLAFVSVVMPLNIGVVNELMLIVGLVVVSINVFVIRGRKTNRTMHSGPHSGPSEVSIDGELAALVKVCRQSSMHA